MRVWNCANRLLALARWRTWVQALLLVTMPALAQPVSDAPFPMLDAGMHTAVINRFAVDRAGRYGVSASHDKTARVWDLTSGALLQTLRVPLGPDDEGKLYAVALSPDGEQVAVSGWTSRGVSGEDSVYLFARSTGRLVGRIPGLPNVVNHIAWSPDGRRLAIALFGKNGIRLHAAAPPYAEIARDADYGGDSYSVDFDRSGRIVSTCWDGKLRLYDAALKPLAPPRALSGGNRPFLARFAPDGRRIAVGFHDSTAVQVVSAGDLAPLRTMDTAKAGKLDLGTVAWSADGRRLFAAGQNRLADGQHPVRVYDPDSGGESAAWPVSTNTVMDLRPLVDGRLVFAGHEPAWGVVDAGGRVLVRQNPPVSDHRSNFDAFRLSRNGDRIEFNHDTWQQGRRQRRTLGMDLRRLQLAEVTAAAADLAAPRREGLQVKEEDWRNTTEPRVGGRRLQLENFETSRSLAIAADARQFALGADYSVRWFDADGTPRWEKAAPAVAWLVNVTADGRYVVAALADGTIRWYRTDDQGSEALALFVHADGKRWVVWTPEGFFAASPDGEALMGYALNQGSRDREADFVSAAQLRESFYRPDLIARRIDGDEAAIRSALARVGNVRDLLAAGLPPEVELLSDPNPVVAAGGDYELKLRITPRRGGIGRLSLRVDGKPQDDVRDPAPIGGVYSQRLRYLPGSYRLDVAVYDQRGQVTSTPKSITLRVDGARPKPQLHLVAVGVSKAVYSDAKLATAGVEFADRDARTFVERLAGQAAGGRLYRAVTSRVLTSAAETRRDAIAAAIGQVPYEPGDTVVVFLAGHGKAVGNKYHFLPSDLALENEAAITGKALTQGQIDQLLRRFASGRVLLVIDTCNAGAMTDSRGIEETLAIEGLMRQTGQVVLAASRSDELAFQDRQQRHGIFTLALLDGLRDADYDRDGVVDAEELAKYIAREVPARSERANPGSPRQVPMRSPTPNAFPLVPVAMPGR